MTMAVFVRGSSIGLPTSVVELHVPITVDGHNQLYTNNYDCSCGTDDSALTMAEVLTLTDWPCFV